MRDSSNSNNNNNNNNNNSQSQSASRPLRVVFLHLDLGIGGAEQLVLQLATASQSLGHEVRLLTTRCDPDHCFASVKPPDGSLYDNLLVRGRWIPTQLLPLLGLGGMTALCSNVRVLYLALWWIWVGQKHFHADLIVLDVLPSPLWLLRHCLKNVALLFYCHFPDKLLVRQSPQKQNQSVQTKSRYRKLMDAVEDSCMPLADLLLVNSEFTRQVVLQEFPSLQEHLQQEQQEQEDDYMQVLYPALDTAAMDAKQINNHNNHNANNSNNSTEITIVSLNRYERKKKIEWMLEAYSLIHPQIQQHQYKVKLIVAGGYDTHNAENVEYRGELQQLAERLELTSVVEFQTSISDAQRTHLLQMARCVVYTPPMEHFGIVPLEVMYAETPVLACNSGGPLETVVHGVTGYLCEPSPQGFATAMWEMISQPNKAHQMGQAGRQHVIEKFGMPLLTQHWNRVTQQACQTQKQTQRQFLQRQQQRPMILTIVLYLGEAILVWMGCIVLTRILRHMGVLQPEETIVGSFRRTLYQTEEL